MTHSAKVDALGHKWLVFLIGPLDFIDMWFGEDQRANIKKDTRL